ncbi:MAG: sodium:proton antiporter [Microcoleaceae cyanobacterium]
MTTELLAVIATFIIGFGLISGLIKKSVITPPMAFVALGLLLSSQFLGLINLNIENEIVKIVMEFTLVLILFTDASRIKLKQLHREQDLPTHLLAIGLPLNIIFGSICAMILFGGKLTFWEAAVLGTILAPTDPDLAIPVVNSPQLPVRIRQTINVESGLNDGICFPILLIFLSLAEIETGNETVGYWSGFIAQQLIFGLIVGIAIGYIGGWLITQSVRKKWMTVSFEKLSGLGLALLAYSLAELVHGNGFIAAFCAGLTVGNTARSISSFFHSFGEAEGQLLSLFTFAIYGAVMVLPVIEQVNWLIVLYAIISLTVVRIISVFISLIGKKLRWETILFFGWFGPRGVASILYAIMTLERHNIAHRETIFTIAIFTILISVFAHGLTAFPASSWYANRIDKLKERSDTREHGRVQEMPVRLPWRD